jgi:hypothetical protein
MLKPRIEAVLAVLFSALALVTAFWPTWIETVFGADPDSGDGSSEWLVVAVFGVVAIAALLLAGRDYRRVRAAANRVVRIEP